MSLVWASSSSAVLRKNFPNAVPELQTKSTPSSDLLLAECSKPYSSKLRAQHMPSHTKNVQGNQEWLYGVCIVQCCEVHPQAIFIYS